MSSVCKTKYQNFSNNLKTSCMRYVFHWLYCYLKIIWIYLWWNTCYIIYSIFNEINHHHCWSIYFSYKMESFAAVWRSNLWPHINICEVWCNSTTLIRIEETYLRKTYTRKQKTRMLCVRCICKRWYCTGWKEEKLGSIMNGLIQL